MVALLALRSRNTIAAVVVALLLVLGFLFFNQNAETPITIRLPILPDATRAKPPVTDHGDNADQVAADSVAAIASNATLGFSKILYVNLKHRWDKADAAIIQAYTSGLDIEILPAVDAKTDIEDQGRIGLPPSSGKETLGAGQIACWRSHANIWNEMVRTRSPPILVIEADASWDVNLRPIMGVFNRHFLRFLDRTKTQARPVEHTPDDPWQSEFWDIMSLGHCHVDRPFFLFRGPQTTYIDEFYAEPPVEGTEYDIPGDVNRVIRRSESFVCTTAYAISHRGAAKLLLRTSLNLDEPVDVIMRHMISSGELISYTLNPPPIVQWAFREGIGMNTGDNSDIHRVDDAPEGNTTAAREPDRSGFEQAHKDHSIWESSKFDGVKFNKPALDLAWATIFSPEAQFTMPEVLPGNGKPFTKVEAGAVNISAPARE